MDDNNRYGWNFWAISHTDGWNSHGIPSNQSTKIENRAIADERTNGSQTTLKQVKSGCSRMMRAVIKTK